MKRYSTASCGYVCVAPLIVYVVVHSFRACAPVATICGTLSFQTISRIHARRAKSTVAALCNPSATLSSGALVSGLRACCRNLRHSIVSNDKQNTRPSRKVDSCGTLQPFCDFKSRSTHFGLARLLPHSAAIYRIKRGIKRRILPLRSPLRSVVYVFVHARPLSF